MQQWLTAEPTISEVCKLLLCYSDHLWTYTHFLNNVHVYSSFRPSTFPNYGHTSLKNCRYLYDPIHVYNCAKCINPSQLQYCDPKTWHFEGGALSPTFQIRKTTVWNKLTLFCGCLIELELHSMAGCFESIISCKHMWQRLLDSVYHHARAAINYVTVWTHSLPSDFYIIQYR